MRRVYPNATIDIRPAPASNMYVVRWAHQSTYNGEVMVRKIELTRDQVDLLLGYWMNYPTTPETYMTTVYAMAVRLAEGDQVAKETCLHYGKYLTDTEKRRVK